MRNSPSESVDSDRIPGPLLRAQVGERIIVCFKNFDTLFNRAHSIHFHGVSYKLSSDGAFLARPGVPRDTQTVGPAESFRLRWREDAPGTWLYHCHVEDHMERGMVGIYRVSR